MTAKEYLGQLRYLDQHIDALLERCERNRARLARCTAAYGGMPRGGKTSDWTDMIARIVEDERRMNADVDKLITLRDSIAKQIAGIQDVRYRRLLELRYLNYRTWEEIAECMDTTVMSLWRWHGCALQKIVVPEFTIVMDC